jgi:hypothetical protein
VNIDIVVLWDVAPRSLLHYFRPNPQPVVRLHKEFRTSKILTLKRQLKYSPERWKTFNFPAAKKSKEKN